MKILKKLVSVLVASCFMISIANLPAVADVYDNTSYENSSENYYTETYTTPAQAAAKASSSSKKVKSTKKKSTKKKTTKKKKSAKKATTKKKATKKVTAKDVNKLATKNIKLINKILKIKGTSKSTKKWLNLAKEYIISINESNKSNTKKYKLLKKALKSVKSIQKAKGSVLSIVKETVKPGSVFSAKKFKKVLESSKTYKIYTKYVAKINNSIDKLLNKDISEEQEYYLKRVKKLVWNKMFGKDSNATKTKWLKKALTSVNNIAKKNVSIASLAKEFIKKKIFAPLKKAFENSTIYKIYKTYKEIGFKAFYKLAEYLDVSLKAVYKAFQKMGVTETQIKKIYSPLMKMLKRDVDICNCAALAVAGCLGIKTNLAALQNLAADIALNTDELVEYFSKEKEIIGTNVDAYEKVLQKNGYYNMVTYGNLTTEDLMSGLKVGEKAILSVECFDGEGHAIAIKKLEKGFAVYDAYVDYADNPKDGIRIYSNEEFKKMLSGKKVKVTGTDLKGKKKTMTVYFKSIEYYSTVTTDSKSIAEIVAKNGYSYIYEW